MFYRRLYNTKPKFCCKSYLKHFRKFYLAASSKFLQNEKHFAHPYGPISCARTDKQSEEANRLVSYLSTA